MIDRLVPPLCLLLAIAMLIAGFGLYATGSPDVPLALHEARVTGDDSYQEVLEIRLEKQRKTRRWMMLALFAGSACMFGLAFLAMRPAERR